jgi:DNA-nicking Smr family endonuclease
MKNKRLDKLYRIPITDDLDLHTFSPREIKSVVTEYISECYKIGIRELKIIHGKGKSVQKSIVYNLLKQNPLVISFQDAPAQFGSWGATMVTLKEKTVIT